jgi:hypothetical protein
MPAQMYRVLSPRGMVRAGRGLLLAGAPEGNDESVATWARRRFGDEFAWRVIDPMVAGSSRATRRRSLWKQLSRVFQKWSGSIGACGGCFPNQAC